MGSINYLPSNVVQNCEGVSSKISSGRPLVNQLNKKNNKKKDLNRNFHTFPLMQAHRLRNPKNVYKR